MIHIRSETAVDTAIIHHVNRQAFGRVNEADLVDALRHRDQIIASLVAVEGPTIVGHILFSPMTIVDEQRQCNAVGMGPVAVLPAYQKRGIGSQLIRVGIETCQQLGHQRLIVLGHSDYYSRFGFVSASRYGVTSTYDVPDDVFMALALLPDAFADCQGVAHYQPEFDAA